jgi:hypothetical protein
MKKLIFPLLTIAFCFYAYTSFSDTITLNQALQNKMINLSINGADNSTSDNNKCSYNGDCISIKIENISGKNLKVFLDAGRFLQPEDTNTQRMIVTKEQMISIEKGFKRNIRIYAMCSQMKNSAPSPATVFLLGKKADGKLLELCQLISKNNFQDYTAQSAIWTLTDNNDIYDIYSDNKDESALLKSFVRKAKGISEESEQNNNSSFKLDREAPGTFVKYGTGSVTGSFEFTLKTDTPLSLTLYNDKGEISHKCAQNYIFHDGHNTLTYEFTYKNFPVGNYYLKMTDDKGTVLLNKLLTFK